MNTYIRWLGVAISCVTLAACTVLQPIGGDGTSLSSQLKAGDQIELTTNSGKHLRLTVQSVDSQGVHSANETVPYSDIQSVSRRETSTGKTTLLVLGILAVGAAAAAGGGGSGGSGSGGY